MHSVYSNRGVIYSTIRSFQRPFCLVAFSLCCLVFQALLGFIACCSKVNYLYQSKIQLYKTICQGSRIYGSDSAGRGTCLFYVYFFLKYSLRLGDPRDTFSSLWKISIAAHIKRRKTTQLGFAPSFNNFIALQNIDT